MIYRHLTTNQVHSFAASKQPLYAVAYHIDNETQHVKLRQLPVLGQIVPRNSRYSTTQYQFAQFNKDGTLSESRRVHYRNRCYADTYDEAVTLYNTLVQERIDDLQNMIADAQKDFLSTD